MRLSRQELYDQVWSEPMKAVAARYALSDVGLKKICVKNRIPVPSRGYWQRLEAGQSPRKIALPEWPGASEIDIRVKPKDVISTPGSKPEEPASVAEAKEAAITVPERLDRPHVATQALRKALGARKPDEYGAIHCVVQDAFLVRIHPDSKDRALRIADAFAKACEKRGFEFQPGREGSRWQGQLRVVVDGMDFAFSIEERMRREPYRMTAAEQAKKDRGGFVWAPKYQHVPTGALTLKIDPAYGSGLRQSWTDGRSRKVEDCLGDVMLGLRRLAVWRIAERDEHRRKQERHDREQQRRAALKDRIEAEREAVTQLEEDARDWRRAEEIRAFVAARGAPDADGSWAAWALAQADRIDPLRESPPSILDTPEKDYRPFSVWDLGMYPEEEDAEMEKE